MSKFCLSTFEKIVVISSFRDFREDIPLSYVGNALDEKQIRTGLTWAHDSETKPANIKYFDNNNFTLEISSCPENSSQGGKLSFWICKITAEDGYSFYTSINSLLLEQLLKESDFIKGVCQDKVMFVRNKSQLGVITKTGELYNELQFDEYMRKNPKAKTDEYKPGDVVGNLKDTVTYLGTLYKYFDWDIDENWRNKEITHKITLYKTPRIGHLYLHKSWWGEDVCFNIGHSKYDNPQEEKTKYFIKGHREIKTIDEYIKDEFSGDWYKYCKLDGKKCEEFYRLRFRDNPNEEIDIEKIKEYMEEYSKIKEPSLTNIEINVVWGEDKEDD